MTDLVQAANRLTALWKSGRDKYASFFHVLNEVQAAIGPEALPDWCVHNLRVQLSVIERVSGVLRSADAEREKLTLAAARAHQKRVAAMERERVKAEAERRRHEREIAKAEREADRQALELEKLRLAKEVKKTANRLRRSDRRDERVQKIKSGPPDNEVLAGLLAECEGIERTRRIELGKRYAAMKDVVQAHRAGKNEDHKYWTWGEWAARYIPRSRPDVWKCIQEYVASCNNSQHENVIHLHKNAS